MTIDQPRPSRIQIEWVHPYRISLHPFWRLLLLAMALFLLSTPTNSITAKSGEVGPGSQLLLTATQVQTDPSTLYLPIVRRHTFPHRIYLPISRHQSPLPSRFGVQMEGQAPTQDVARIAGAGVGWVHYGAVEWALVEPQPGERNWAALAKFETDMLAIRAAGLEPMVIILNTPVWAQLIYPYRCGPIAEHALDDFANFMADLVSRYSRPPYNIRYWEVGNEPDADYRLVAPHSGFGCWGDRDQAYHGGGRYGQMLQVVYPAIKNADRRAQLVFGGLLLDCDPTHPEINGVVRDCTSGDFLEGALAAGGGGSFDILSFHSYANYWPGIAWDRDHQVWAHRGGIVVGKASFLREVMGRYGLNKPLFLNESALLCHPTVAEVYGYCPKQANAQADSNPKFRDFFDAQANYAVRLMTRAYSLDLMGVTWYSYQPVGWLHSGLLTQAREDRPSLWSISAISRLLQNANYIGPLLQGDVEGYAFQKDGQELHIYWSNLNYPSVILMPPGAVGILDKFGQPQTRPGQTLTIEFDPIILILDPDVPAATTEPTNPNEPPANSTATPRPSAPLWLDLDSQLRDQRTQY